MIKWYYKYAYIVNEKKAAFPRKKYRKSDFLKKLVAVGGAFYNIEHGYKHEYKEEEYKSDYDSG